MHRFCNASAATISDREPTVPVATVFRTAPPPISPASRPIFPRHRTGGGRGSTPVEIVVLLRRFSPPCGFSFFFRAKPTFTLIFVDRRSLVPSPVRNMEYAFAGAADIAFDRTNTWCFNLCRRHSFPPAPVPRHHEPASPNSAHVEFCSVFQSHVVHRISAISDGPTGRDHPLDNFPCRAISAG